MGRRAGRRWSGCSPVNRAAPARHRCGDPADEVPLSRKRAAYQPPDESRSIRSSVPYAELHTHSAYSFLDGASAPEELVEEAARLDLRAIALTDHNGLYGAVRFAEAAVELDISTVFGAELSLGPGARTDDPDPAGPHLLVLARGPEGYRRLSRQLAAAHLAGGEKGKPRFDFDTLTDAAGGHWHILTGCRKGHVRRALDAGGPDAASAALADLVDRFGSDRVSVELTHHGCPLDDEVNAELAYWQRDSASAVLRPPARISPRRRGAGWRWPWGRYVPGSRWTRPPAGWPRWAARICGPVKRWRGCSRSVPTW